MQQISVESGLGQKLGEVSNQVVVCDASGRVLGFFSPLMDRPRVEDLQLEPPLSIAETEQLRKKTAPASRWKKSSDGWDFNSTEKKATEITEENRGNNEL